MLAAKRGIDVGIIAKSAYGLVQQTRLDHDPLSRKTEIAHPGNPCRFVKFEKIYIIDNLNMSNRKNMSNINPWNL